MTLWPEEQEPPLFRIHAPHKQNRSTVLNSPLHKAVDFCDDLNAGLCDLTCTCRMKDLRVICAHKVSVRLKVSKKITKGRDMI